MVSRLIASFAFCLLNACLPVVTPTKPPLPTQAPPPTGIGVTNHPAGFYYLTPVIGNPEVAGSNTFSLRNPEVLNHARVAGVVIRVSWATVNPAPDKYDWTEIDKAIGVIAPKKHFKIKVMTGTRAPEWLEEKGAQFFSARNPNPQQFHNKPAYSLPVPWDSVMLHYYGVLLKEMARKYDGHPQLDLITIGGPTLFSLEMHLPPETTSQDGYSTNALVQAWVTSIRNFSDTFRFSPGGIDYANPINARDGIADAVAQEHIRILGNRAVLQMDALNAKDQSDYNIFQLIPRYSSQATTGFEQVTASSDARYGGSFVTSMKKAQKAGAKFVDFYSSDLGNITKEYGQY